MVDFILVPTDEQPQIARYYVAYEPNLKYPRNWARVSWLIRKLAGFRCEWCGSSHKVRCHHMGVPFADGTPGNSGDKHDLRRENLYCLCGTCEKIAETAFPPRPVPLPDGSMTAKRGRSYRSFRRAVKRMRKASEHRALGVGTGLIPL